MTAFFAVLLTPLLAGAQQINPYVLQPEGERMYMIEQTAGQLHCRIASEDETAMLQPRDESVKRIYPTSKMQSNAGAFHIVLEGTAQLDGFPAAKAAFIKAAQIWENRINNPLTVTIQVDFGPTRFGTAYPSANILGSTSSRQYYVNYTAARAQVVAHADNAAETSLYAKFPSTSTVPTDLGSATRVLGSSIQLLTLGFTLPADRQLPSIGFNSAFNFDLDATNGIDPGKYDFEAVTVHELGHALGFGSSVGDTELTPPATEVAPTIWDLFRFRPGVTSSTFQTAQRPMASGGTHVHFAGGSSLQMSTGRADNTGGDEQQSSHWKDNTGGNPFIGLMDPTIPSGTHIELSANDLAAFEVMGYSIVTSNATVPAAPSNLTATATSASIIRLNWVDNSNDEAEFRIEQKVNNAFVDLGAAGANATTINVTGFSAGQTATFRIRARNATGDSGYSNEASATTPGGNTGGPCTPNANTVCLLSDRFRVSIDYVNAFVNPPQPGKFIGAKLVGGVQNPDVATFGISGAQAIEVVVRIQDARPFGLNRFDIYYGGLTDLEYTVTITDTQTGTTRTYRNAPGNVGGGVDRTSFTGALGGEDRITSGGYDTFPAGITLVPVETQIVRMPLTRSDVRTLQSDVHDAIVAHAEGMTITPHAAGGGGACSEVEPNQSLAQASNLPLNDPCTGFVDLTNTGSITLDFGDGITDNIEDVFKVTLPSSAKLNVILSFTNTVADLDMYIFQLNGTSLDVVGYSNTTETTESDTTDTLPAGTYYVGVSAFSGQSNYTVIASAVGLSSTPAAPTNLTATAISSSQIQLSWTDNSNNETGFVVEGAVGNSGFAPIDPVQPANTTGGTVTISNPVAGTTFKFRVKARNGSGDSAYSNEASATLPSNNSGTCTASSTVACLLDGRFRVSIAYINSFANPPQPGNFLGAKLVAGSQNPDVATFGISSAQAIEAVVRIQDTRPFGLNRFDVYYGGLTDLEYTVSVTDVVKGVSKTYRNAPGNVGGGVDRTTFTTN
ncbi:MAG TPA: NF038122 family metalloprotease [Thermoanaerobaculia bacterium]|nr:NF038122 family metalloprotease [Thermoanaerobaculia bacterium]